MGLYHIPFVVRAADIDETMDPQKPADQEVRRVSRLKALAVQREKEDVVVAADTIVVCDNRILGKPRDKDQAVRMLELLSGRDHQVMTGCTVVRGDRVESFTEITDLHFRPLSHKEILSYVESGEPMDKAGAYGIQGGAALFCQQLRGDYYNVVGLPVCRLYKTLSEIVPEWMEESE